MPDVTIPLQSVGGGVWQFTVPATGEILIKNLRGVFDGTGIGSAWFPAVRIIAPGNVTDGDFPTDSSLAAGASAEVSFFPRGKAAAGSTPPPSAALTFAIAYRNNFSVPSAPGGSSSNFDPWTKLDASDGNITLDGSNRVVIGAAGLYQVNVGMNVGDNTWLGTDTMDINFLLVSGLGSNAISTTWPGQTTLVGPNNPSGATKEWEISALVWLNIDTPGEVVRAQVVAVTGGPAHTATNAFAVMSVLRVGDFTTGGVH